MKACKGCGKDIDDRYELCVQCNLKNKELNKDTELINVLKEMNDNLKHINWNIGSAVMLLKGDKKTLKKIEDDMKNAINSKPIKV